MMMRPAIRRIRAASLLAVWVSACESPVGLPSGSVPFVPPAVYSAWWKLTEKCSGRTGNLSDVHWFVDTASTTFDLGGEAAEGAWYSDGNRIVLTSRFVNSGPLVRHEMLHALLQRPGHPRSEFLGSCNDIVVCEGQCVRDAGGAPDTSGAAPFVLPDFVEPSLLVVPGTVSVSADSGWFTVTVELSNPAPHAVNVTVPFANNWVSIAFSGTGGSDSTGAYDASALSFAAAGQAGSVRRVVFDVKPILPGRFSLSPGLYAIGGTFLTRSLPRVRLTVKP